MKLNYYLLLLFVFLFSGCDAFYNQPTGVEKAVLGENTSGTSLSDNTSLYSRHIVPRRSRFGIEVGGGTSRIDGDYANPTLEPMARGALKYFVTPSLNISASTNAVMLGSKNLPDAHGYLTFDLNLELLLLPRNKLSPYIYGGGGYGMDKNFENTHKKVQFGVGAEYMVTNAVGIKLFGESDINFTDNLDHLVAGTGDDYYYKFGLALTCYFPAKNRKK